MSQSFRRLVLTEPTWEDLQRWEDDSGSVTSKPSATWRRLASGRRRLDADDIERVPLSDRSKMTLVV